MDLFVNHEVASMVVARNLCRGGSHRRETNGRTASTARSGSRFTAGVGATDRGESVLADSPAGHWAEVLGPEGREPLELMPPGIAAAILERIDAALDEGNLRRALALERLLPSTLGAEPAVVDRLVTLRLLEGDVQTAAAGLGASPAVGGSNGTRPRLRLLALVVAVGVGDPAAIAAEMASPGPCGLACRCLGLILEALGAASTRPDRLGPGADPAAALCRIAAEYPRPVASLTAALGLLEQLLVGLALRQSPNAARALRAIRGVARDLDIGFDALAGSDELAVTPSDRATLRLRAA